MRVDHLRACACTPTQNFRRKLLRGEPFSLTRYGDGEIWLMRADTHPEPISIDGFEV